MLVWVAFKLTLGVVVQHWIMWIRDLIIGLNLCKIRHTMTIHHKAPFARIFSSVLHFFVVFTRVPFLRFAVLKKMFTVQFSICIFKARLGGEICFTDVILYKGYFNPELCFSGATGTQSELWITGKYLTASPSLLFVFLFDWSLPQKDRARANWSESDKHPQSNSYTKKFGPIWINNFSAWN